MDWCIRYEFPGTAYTADKTINVTWYNGDLKPSAEVRALLEGDPLPENGSIFVGTQGTMVLPHIARPLLYPDKKYKDLKFPEVPADDHWGQFATACLTA